nr:hypothetical protein JOCKYQNQ_JOCKYQNQ_CDS_0005 [Autographiviridae sp.]
MGTLKRKLKDYITMFKIKRRDKDSMKLIKWSLRYLLFCLLLYLAMTIYEWIVTGHANLSEFRQYVTAVGGLTIAIQTFSKWLVDEDKDGVPDEAKKGERRLPYDPR